MLLKKFLNDVHVLGVLANSDYDFYLTGSRYFNTKNNSISDWDIFVQYSEEVENLLIELGFIPKSKTIYNTFQGLKKIYHNKMYNVDVQLIDNAYLKNEIQTKIKESRIFDLKHYNKKERTIVWETAYQLYKL